MRLVVSASIACVMATCGSAAAQSITPSCAPLQEAIQLFQDVQHRAAYIRLDRAAAQGCADPNLFLYKGLIERAGRNMQQAIKSFLQGLELDPKSIPLRLELAVTYSWNDQLDESLNTYREVLVREPQRSAARAGEARVLGWMGHREEAVSGFTALLGDEPGNVEALSGLAAVHAASLNKDLARLYYGRALALEPANAEAKEGLRRVDAITRLQLWAGLTETVTPVGRGSALGMYASYRVTPELRLVGGYNAVPGDSLLEQVDRPSTAVSFSSSEWRVGVERRLDRATVASAEFKRQTTGGQSARSVSIEGSRTIRPRITVLGGMRPSTSASDGLSLLGWSGVSLAFAPGATVTVQGFRGTARTGTSDALAVSTRLRAGPRHEIYSTLATGRHAAFRYQTISGGIGLETSTAGSVRVEFGVRLGQYQTSRLSVLLTRRF